MNLSPFVLLLGKTDISKIMGAGGRYLQMGEGISWPHRLSRKHSQPHQDCFAGPHHADCHCLVIEPDPGLKLWLSCHCQREVQPQPLRNAQASSPFPFPWEGITEARRHMGERDRGKRNNNTIVTKIAKTCTDFLCARHCSKRFKYTRVFYLQNNAVTSSPFCRWGNCGLGCFFFSSHILRPVGS